MSKISVKEFIANRDLLEINYVPFDQKLEIVSKLMNSFIEDGNINNSSIVRRISTEIFIEAITNLDLSIVDENELGGYDQLCLNRSLESLKELIKLEYMEFENILRERMMDYNKIDTNCASAILYVYNNIIDIIKSVSRFSTNDFLSEDEDEGE